MEIKTLENVSVAEVTNAFNAVFNDYKVRMQLTEEAMVTKIKAEGIQLQLSPGAFDGDKLVGLILIATDCINGERLAYNAGTGVTPEYRGAKLAEKMYAFIISLLKQQGYSKHILEVFEDNVKALPVYRKPGFEVTRNMCNYKGFLSKLSSFEMAKKVELDEALFKYFWDVEPSWQNNLQCIKRNLGEHTIIGIEDEGAVVAYAIYIKKTGRVKQVAVEHSYRHRGLGTQLMRYICSTVESEEIMLTGVEVNETVDVFLKSKGLQFFINILEMDCVA